MQRAHYKNMQNSIISSGKLLCFWKGKTVNKDRNQICLTILTNIF